MIFLPNFGLLQCITELRSKKQAGFGAKRPFCSQLEKVYTTWLKDCYEMYKFLQEKIQNIAKEIDNVLKTHTQEV